MNILLISQMYPTSPGRPSKEVNHALHYLARHWAPKENLLVVRSYFTPDLHGLEGPVTPGLFNLDGVKVLKCPFFKVPGMRLFYLGRLYRELKRLDFLPQVVVAHLGFSLLLGYQVARHFRVPFIPAVHFGDLVRGPKMLSPGKMARIYAAAAGVACRSIPVYREFVKRYPGLESRSFIAFSGIESRFLQGDGDCPPGTAWAAGQPGEIRFLSACTLIPLKNIPVNLGALARLGKDIPWRYTVIGDGPERDRLERLARELDIDDRVVFTGHLERRQVLQEMRRGHVFLMVSAPETFGLAYLEAMASGNVVVGARGYGIDGVVRHGENGFLCTPGSEESLFAVLEEIVAKVGKGGPAAVAERGRRTAANYTEEKAAQNYLDNIKKFSGYGN